MKIIWNSSVQPKVNFFPWEAAWGKVLTLDQVQKRGWALANRCYLCQTHEETIDHLLLHCEETRDVWKLFFTLFHSVRETLLGWKGSFVGKKHRAVWNASPLCLFWSVWKARNIIAFEGGVLSMQRRMQKLKVFFVYLLWLESKLFIKCGPSMLINCTDWVGSLWGKGFFVHLVRQVFCFSCKGVSVSFL